MRLAQIKNSFDKVSDSLYDLFLKQTTILEPRLPESLINGCLTKVQRCQIEELTYTKQFEGLVENMEEEPDRWETFMQHPKAEEAVPEPWAQGDDVSLSNGVVRILK